MTSGLVDEERNRALCIHPSYQHRPDPIHYDDRKQTDNWQNEVYRLANRIAVERKYRSVVDFGCGSGFKLMKYFAGFETVGYEVDPALSFLRQAYPDRCWRDGADDSRLAGDMLICSDVIEHLANPIGLLERMRDSPVRTIILSTPALEILAERGQSLRLGPPDNRSHLNEWTTREFRDFCDMHLKVLNHMVVSAAQGTQLIVAQPR